MTISEFINKVGFQVNKNDVQNVNSTIQSIKSTAVKLLGAIGIGFSLNQLRQISEEFNGINDSINYTYKELSDTKEAQKKILKAANDTKTSYGSMAGVVTKLTQLNEDMFPIDDATTFATVVQQLTIASGKSESEAIAAQDMLARAFQSSIVDAGTLTRLQRQAPALYKEIANAIGVTTEEMQQMAKEGKLTAQQVKDAIISSKNAAQMAFDGLDYSISDAMTNIRNQWGFFLDDFNSTFGITQTIAKAMVSGFTKFINVLKQAKDRLMFFADKIGGVNNLLKLAAIVAGAFFLAFNFDKISTGIKTITKLLHGFSVKAMLIIGVIVLIALLVEDFINFMQGNDSLLGSLLEEAGVDVDKFRQDLLDTWENIKTALGYVWEGIKNVAIPLFKAVWDAISSALQGLWDLLKKIAPDVADFFDRMAHGEVNEEEWKKVGEVIAIVAGAILGVVAALKIFAAIQAIVNAVMAASPITWIILAIIALIAIVILCIKYWDKIKAFLQAVWESIKQAFVNAWKKIKAAWDRVVSFFEGIWNGIVKAFRSVVSWFGNLFRSAWNAVKKAWSAVTGFFSGIWNGIKRVFNSVISWFSSIFTGAWNAITGVWNSVTGWFSGVWQGICDVFSGVVEWFSGIFSDAWQAVQDVFSTVTDFFSDLWDGIVEIFTTIGTTVGNAIGSAFATVVNAIIDFAEGTINFFIRAINGAIELINNIPGVEIGLISELQIPRLAKGGYVEANKPRPVIVGDNPREGEIVSPISKMRNTVLEALRMFMPQGGPFSGTAALTQSGSSNRSVTQNVEINNTFNGDKAIQQKAAATMDRSAQDVTAQLARGLAYAK